MEHTGRGDEDETPSFGPVLSPGANRARQVIGAAEERCLVVSRRGELSVHEQELDARCLKRMGYKGAMTGHGFRGLASTILNETGYERAHIEMQLAHASKNEVEAAYNKALYLPQRQKVVERWAEFLDEARDFDKGSRRISPRNGKIRVGVKQGGALQPTV